MWDISWLAVIGSALVGLVVGGLWYGPLLGKRWQSEVGMSDETMKSSNMPLIFGTMIALNLFSAFILGHVLATYGGPGLQVSMMIGFGIGLGFVATALGVNYLFQRKSLVLFGIDAGYWVVTYTLMGAVFGALR